MNDLPEFDNTHNKQSLDEARFLNLASGLLSSYSGTRVREILVGSSPKEWPPDVPILEGSQVIGSLVRAGSRMESTGDYADLTLLSTIALSPDDVLDRYDELLLSVGWRTYDMEKKRGGFSSRSTPSELEYFKSAQGLRLQVKARKVEDMEGREGTGGLTEVFLCLDKNLGSLRRSRWEKPAMRSEQLMPALKPPRDAQQGSSASNGSEGDWNSNTGLWTRLDGASLMFHYAKQLDHAGWVQSEEGQSGPVTWQTWDLNEKHGENWGGALLILERKRKREGAIRRYYLSVQIYKIP